MIKCKVVCFFTIFFTGLIFGLSAQQLHDPNDRLYKDIDVWAVQGYITQALPMIRPYPLQVVDEFLADVVDNGDDDAAAKAQRYRDALLLGNGPRNSGTALYANDRGVLHAGVTGSLEGLDDDVSVLGAPFVDGTLRLKDWLTGSFSMYVYGSNRSPQEGYNAPGTYSPYPDMISDTSDVGKLKITQNWTSALAVGTSGFYFQSGLIRSSFGPIYDNGVIVGPQAPRAGHFSVVYREPKWSFEMLWLELTATDTIGSARDSDKGRYSGKHLVSHIYSFRPVPSFEVSFFETMVWGPRIDPLYILPFAMLFASQSMADFGDNAFMGLLVRWHFARNLQFLTQFYVDDFHFNDMVKFKFNTKYKFAAEMGFVWAPKEGPLRSLSADYTAIVPYMYTHIYDLDSTTYGDRYPSQPGYTGPHANYLDYSHVGKNLGADLEPNSDRISVRSAWKTLPNLELGLSAYFIRHGNASENRLKDELMDGEYHDGSIFDDGSNDGEFTDAYGNSKGKKDNYDNNYRKLHFLTQSTLETKLAGGITLTWYLPSRLGEFSLNAEYVAEYGWNRGLIRNNNSLMHYWAVGGTYRF